MEAIHAGSQVKSGDVITLCHIERKRYSFAWSGRPERVTCERCQIGYVAPGGKSR